MAPLRSDSSSGVRARNFSKLHGYKMYQYEYFYQGGYCPDVVTSVTLYLDVANDTVASYEKYEAKIFREAPVDGTFELYSLLSVYHSPEELQRSIFIRLEDVSEDYRDAFKCSDLIKSILDVLNESNFEVVSFYCDYTFKCVDDEVDLFDLHVCLG